MCLYTDSDLVKTSARILWIRHTLVGPLWIFLHLAVLKCKFVKQLWKFSVLNRAIEINIEMKSFDSNGKTPINKVPH